MATQTAYVMLCTDLGLLPGSVPPPLRDLLHAKLDAAAAELSAAGVVLDPDSIRDLDLQVLYAAWLYRGRVKQSEPPQMLQRLIHNRQVSRATGGGAS